MMRTMTREEQNRSSPAWLVSYGILRRTELTIMQGTANGEWEINVWVISGGTAGCSCSTYCNRVVVEQLRKGATVSSIWIWDIKRRYHQLMI